MAPPSPDLLVVGAGLAGGLLALEAAALGARVTLVAGAPMATAISYGGVPSWAGADDGPWRHAMGPWAMGRRSCGSTGPRARTPARPWPASRPCPMGLNSNGWSRSSGGGRHRCWPRRRWAASWRCPMGG
jgi:choline dehydrogenase-like flavoprotein